MENEFVVTQRKTRISLYNKQAYVHCAGQTATIYRGSRIDTHSAVLPCKPFLHCTELTAGTVLLIETSLERTKK